MSLKKYQREQQKKLNRYAREISLILAGALSVFLVGTIYLYSKVWNPLRGFSAKKSDYQMEVEIALKVPADVTILYGTSPETLRYVELGEIKGHATKTIRGILPNKTHFVRIKTVTDNGNVYITEPLKIL